MSALEDVKLKVLEAATQLLAISRFGCGRPPSSLAIKQDYSSQWPQLYLLQSVSTLHHKGSLTLLSSLSILLVATSAPLLCLFLSMSLLGHCRLAVLLYCGGNEYHCLPNMHGFMQPYITL